MCLADIFYSTTLPTSSLCVCHWTVQGQMTPLEPGITFPAWSLLPARCARQCVGCWRRTGLAFPRKLKVLWCMLHVEPIDSQRHGLPFRCSYRSCSVLGSKGEEVRHYQGHPQCFSKQESLKYSSEKKLLFFKTCTCIISPPDPPTPSRKQCSSFTSSGKTDTFRFTFNCVFESSTTIKQLTIMANITLLTTRFGNPY